jgi:hypothetical protein
MAMESLAGAFAGFTEDLKEVASFREKRKPRFIDRVSLMVISGFRRE